MNLPAYLARNLVASAAAISVSSEDALFTKDNLADEILGKVFKFTSGTTGYIEIDHGSAKDYDMVAVLGHNLTSGSSIVVKGGAAPNPGTVIGTATYRADCVWIPVGARTERYTRIVFTDTNPDVILVGELAVGKRVLLPRAAKWGEQATRLETDLTFQTIRGVDSAFKLSGREARQYKFKFPQSEYLNFRDQHIATAGQIHPFVWIPDVSADDVLYVRKQPNFEPQASEEPGQDGSQLDHWFDYVLDLKEEVHGTFVLD
jgi:hypothetical protein